MPKQITERRVKYVDLAARDTIYLNVEKPECTVHVGDVKGEIAFLGPLLHFKGLAQGLCDVCFERIASCLPGIQGEFNFISQARTTPPMRYV